MTNEEITSRFTSHQLDPEGISKLNTVRTKIEDLALLLNELVTDPRANALVMTNLESVMFAANAGISRNYPSIPNQR